MADHDDQELTAQIADLVEEEHRLREHPGDHGKSLPDEQARIAAIEGELDRLWDLRRQRDARRAAHQDPDGSAMRSENVVKRYLQ